MEKKDQELAGILRDLAMLARENCDVRAGNLSDAEYREHCELVAQHIQTAFPADEKRAAL